MPDLDTIAARHGFPVDAAQAMLDALGRGGGRMAQFSHPALGGMGQWDAGGMIMIGDMFNDALKAKVAALAKDLAPLAEKEASPRGDSETSGSDASGSGWPKELGHAASSGSQNGARYAVFPDSRRLAVSSGGKTTVYDTGDHRISGVSQQQGGGRDLSFSGQNGTVRLSDLEEVASPESGPSAHGTQPPAGAAAPEQHHDSSSMHPAGTHGRAGQGAHGTGHHDDVALIERLSELHKKGVLSDDEYRAKKAEVLGRL